ncbi:hypothetical protein C8R44DRAFT_607925 [Mycena epipterygia]|nr:hypothetical protein C8R44DRAFT_607925 [Mycena epipterygia]
MIYPKSSRLLPSALLAFPLVPASKYRPSSCYSALRWRRTLHVRPQGPFFTFPSYPCDINATPHSISTETTTPTTAPDATSISDAEATTALPTSSSNHGGSSRWLAPELIHPTAFGCERFAQTPASDVYAYICVCVELYTGSPPMSDVKPDVAAMLRVLEGERSPRPAEMLEELWNLVTAAWATDSKTRPKIHDIVSMFPGSSNYSRIHA